MKYSVITTFHKPGLDKYAQTMINSFEEHWPNEINLYVYAEDCQPHVSKPNIHILDLHATCLDLVAFKNKHKNNPVANGEVMKDTGIPYKDNNFKWDAVRFSHKVFSVIHACTTLNSDWVIWLDADSKTFKDIPFNFLKEVCPDEYYVSYLGRNTKYHSECGWVAYNTKHKDNRDFMNYWRNLYVNDSLFNLREYHDSFVFDEIRKKFQQERNTPFYNLTPPLKGKGPGHPFIASVLGKYMDHMKGTQRKELGHSLPDDVSIRNQNINSDVDYWKNIKSR